MPEFKKKTALGLRDLPENGQECTHVLLTHSEYDGLLAKVACAERDARSVYAFNAGFIYGLYHNYDIRTCIAMGNRMGGACVSKVGCLSGYLTEEQLLREFQASNSSC